MATWSNITQHVQYLCAQCSTLLKETDTPLDDAIVNSTIEACPGCGRSLNQQIVAKKHKASRPEAAEFQTAHNITPARFSFDISAIDRLLVLADKGIIFVTSRDGWHANTLVTRAVVRALMSKRQGGFGSPSVAFIDAGNCSDIYECVDFARQYGLDAKQVLDSITVSRPFTIHQLARLVVHDLQSAVQRLGAKLVAISDIMHMFVQDPQMDQDEAHWIIKEIARALKKLSTRALILVSITRLPQYADDFLSLFDSRINIDCQGSALPCIDMEISHRQPHEIHTLTLPEKDLLIVPAR